MLRTTARLAVVSTVLLHALHAGAGESIEIPPECGSAEEFTRELERLLGDRAAEGRPQSLVISAQDAAGTYTLRMQLRTETRELKDTDCRALFRSAVVIAAASASPDAEEGKKARSPERPASAPPSSQTSRERVENPTLAPTEGARESEGAGWLASVHMGVGAMVGVLPGVAPMLELSGAIARSRWGIFGALEYLPRTRKAEAGRGVSIWALGGQLAILFEPVERLRLSGGVAAHRLEGQGFGFSESLSDSAWSVAPVLEATLVASRTRNLRVELGVQGYVSIVRARFEIENLGEIHRASPFAGAAVARVAFPL